MVKAYFENNSLEGIGLVLHGDLITAWETEEESTDDVWKNQECREIVCWRFFEESGVHVLELENGTMIHMFAERRYPLTVELMRRMLEHGLEVEEDNETACMVINLFINWTTIAEDDQ